MKRNLKLIADAYFNVDVLSSTQTPQILCWQALHQCYSEFPVVDVSIPDEPRAGELIIKHLLEGHRGHYSPLEQASISFNVVGFPHSVMQQFRTHRVGVSFSVQSGRYTGKRVCDAGKMIRENWSHNPDKCYREVDKIFYLRPVGTYHDRSGKKYEYRLEHRLEDLDDLVQATLKYSDRLSEGFSEEHSRGLLPFDIRQDFVMGCNARSLMHLLDLRMKADAQLEAVTLAEMLFEKFQIWMPEVAGWYEKNRARKARLAP